MKVCQVIGHVWATKKDENLNGYKLMIVQEVDSVNSSTDTFVAADMVGAGLGENVLVVSGSTARMAAGNVNTPIDCAIVGIIDSMETMKKEGAEVLKE